MGCFSSSGLIWRRYFYQEQFAVGKNKSFIVDRRSFMVDDDDDDDDDF